MSTNKEATVRAVCDAGNIPKWIPLENLSTTTRSTVTMKKGQIDNEVQ